MLLTEVALVRAHGAHTEQGAGILTISEPLMMDACMLRHVRRVQEETRCLVASRCTGVGKQKNKLSQHCGEAGTLPQEISSEFQVLSRFLPHIYMTAINLGTISLTFVAWAFYSLGDS